MVRQMWRRPIRRRSKIAFGIKRITFWMLQYMSPISHVAGEIRYKKMIIDLRFEK